MKGNENENYAAKASYHHEVMNAAYQSSQDAWNSNRKADAKLYSQEMKVHRDLMKHYGALAKEENKNLKKDNIIKMSNEMEKLITNEYRKIESESNSSVLKSLNDEYVKKMNKCYNNSQESWNKGLKSDAKQYADLRKAYRILVHFSSETLKNAKKKDHTQNKEYNDADLINFLNSKYCELDELDKSLDCSKFSEQISVDDSFDYRALANELGGEMTNNYQLSREAWNQGDKAAAKKYAEKGDSSRQNMEIFKKEAAIKAFTQNNKFRENDEIDLHGLTVADAQLILDGTLEKSKEKGVRELKVIVGKGLHSGKDGPKLKELVVNYAKVMGITYKYDEKNEGCILLILNNK